MTNTEITYEVPAALIAEIEAAAKLVDDIDADLTEAERQLDAGITEAYSVTLTLSQRHHEAVQQFEFLEQQADTIRRRGVAVSVA